MEVIARAALVSTTMVMMVACSDPAAHVRFDPIDFAANCGKPPAASVTAVQVIAYTAHGESRHPDGELDDLTADTVQLGVEVEGGAGVVLATGKTAPLDYNDLADGTELPLAMIPLDGFCEVSPMSVPRAQPVAARAGAGVLVFGGDIASTAEYYDPATATFTVVPLPSVLDPTTLAGASLATLADGRAVLSGGQVMIVFDPTTRAFLQPTVVQPRSEHRLVRHRRVARARDRRLLPARHVVLG